MKTSLESATKHSDLVVAFGVIAIILVMIIPIPSIMLDMFLALSISIGLVILLSTLYIKQPLEFSSFPSLLLVVTLFRLSLNIASTRLILLHGNEGTEAAGQVIKSFGGFVVGGNYVVGFVIFLILVIINFMVITKGAVRTSEVAARFTLDAMPGKQMSIDADLNAGIITDNDARKRRRHLEREADFYGHMDGAIRFVRGDAIAGIIITIVNILGGFMIGVFQHDMQLMDSLQIYTVLTIGDGLVSQLPALVISTASGIVVTRSASDSNLGTDLVRELLFQPRIFIIITILLTFLGLVPGLPHFSFFMLAAVSGFFAQLIMKDQKANIEHKKIEADKQEESTTPEKVEALLPLDIIGLEVGYKLIPLVDSEKNGELLERIRSIRRQFALESGIIVPSLHIKDNLQIEPNSYRLLIKGVVVASANIMTNRFLAMNPGTATAKLKGTETKEPTFGLPATWIDEGEKDRAQIAGYTVVDAATVITTHIKEIIKQHAHELLGRQDVQKLLDNIKEDQPKIVEDLIPNIISLGTLQKVLQNLLREQVSVRDLVTILESLADYGQHIKDADTLTEFVRQALSRPITSQYQNTEGIIPVVTVDKEIEDLVSNSIQKTEHGSFLALEPGAAKAILSSLNILVDKFTQQNSQPVILSSPKIRGHFKKFTERFVPNLVVLSYNEIVPSANINTLGMLSLK